MWINVDIPTKKVTLHEDDCVYIPSGGYKYKGFKVLLRDGGWLHFDNKEQALMEHEDKLPDYQRGYCYTCDSRQRPEVNKESNKSDIHPPASEEELRELRETSGHVSWEYSGKEYGFDEEDK